MNATRVTTHGVHRRLMRHARKGGCSVEVAEKMIRMRVEMIQLERGLSTDEARVELAKEWRLLGGA